jgi:hypothetical protein
MSLRLRSLPPLSLRLLVVLLAFVQFIAPTWHVCEMGGHVMAMRPGASMAHHGDTDAAQAKQASADGPMQPLICYCAPKPKHQENPNWPKLTPVVSHDEHVTCLALLLQTMPGAVAAPATLLRIGAPVEFSWQARPLTSPSFSPLPRFRGRAPPLGC